MIGIDGFHDFINLTINDNILRLDTLQRYNNFNTTIRKFELNTASATPCIPKRVAMNIADIHNPRPINLIIKPTRTILKLLKKQSANVLNNINIAPIDSILSTGNKSSHLLPKNIVIISVELKNNIAAKIDPKLDNKHELLVKRSLKCFFES